jgi:FtsP/CotA-like multicopper oxidase with cupredoxin domain
MLRHNELPADQAVHMIERYTRRNFLVAGVAAGTAYAAGLPATASEESAEFVLNATPAKADIVGGDYPKTMAWTYNGSVPGPLIRKRQGDRLRVRVHNRLAEPTTVHFHGIRMSNAMDGVPFVTQDPIAPKSSFLYDFKLPDAGTFWYHPHLNSSEQVARGLSGPLIVEERNPIAVDRDLLWVLDDWLLDKTAAIAGGFGNPHDLSHNGRIGNTVTINGRLPRQVSVRSGERIRLRLVNVANARIFALRFDGHTPKIIALDGQPVPAHAPDDSTVILAPAQRADLILDMTQPPGSRFTVSDRYYGRQAYRLVDIAYGSEKPLRKEPPDTPIELPANPLPEPKLKDAARHEVVLEGGAMSGMMGGGMGGMMGGGPMGMHARGGRGLFWALNGVAMPEDMRRIDPLLTLQQGKSHILTLRNETAWDHPMHLHGHSFRVLSRNGKPETHTPWLDTVLLHPRDRVEIAFVADNPGDWMFHCHILEHQKAGMMATVRVA